MEYLKKFQSSVSLTVNAVAQQVNQALPGNPLLREYEVHNVNIASAGPALAWKIYSATKNSTKQAVSIWLFEKKQIEKWPRAEREAFPDLLKRGVSQLTRLRHPRILTIEHSLEESRDNFAFCTEPVVTSLANAFGDWENVEERSKQAENVKFSDIEIRHGLFQLSEALVFLHNDAKLLHCNVCPSSIVVNSRGAWKLAGFDFCVLGNPNTTGKTTFDVREWDRCLMSAMQPTLDYASPELVKGSTTCGVYVDVFSLGMLAAALFNECKPILAAKGLLETYKTKIEALRQTNIENALWFGYVPQVLGSDLKACLNQTPELRPDAYQLTKLVYFDDPTLKTLNYLESLMQMDVSQKMQFFKGLPQIMDKYPKRALLQKIFPYLIDEFNNVELIPFVLPSIFFVIEQTDKNEFSTKIFPSLVPVFRIQKPYQIVLLILQKMSLLLEKTPEAEVKQHLLPLIYSTVSNENPRIQELCLSIIPTVGKLIDRDAMKTQLLPKLIKLIVEGSVLSIRVQTLLCIAKLLPTLEPWMVSDQILSALAKINSREPGILMAVLGIIKLANENERFGIAREQCARSILPFLIANCVENTLNLTQFEQFMQLTKTLLGKVEVEQRQRLQQLGKSQEEQMKPQDFNDIFNQCASSNVMNNGGGVTDLFVTLENSSSPFAANQTSLAENTHLSLEKKKRLAAEKEQQQRLQQSASALGSIGQTSSTAKNHHNTFTSDDFDLFDIKDSSSAATSRNPPLDMFDPYSNSHKNTSQATIAQQSMPVINNTFGSLPLPPSVSNPINRQQSTMNSQPTNSQPTNSQKSKLDPFDLFSLENVTQSPNNGFGATANNKQVPKSNPLDFLN